MKLKNYKDANAHLNELTNDRTNLDVAQRQFVAEEEAIMLKGYNER